MNRTSLANSDGAYAQEPLDGGRVRFRVQPARAPSPRGLPFAVALIVGVGGWALPLPLAGRIALGAIASAWAFAATRRLLLARLERARHPGGGFTISAAGIELPDRGLIARGHVRRLIVATS